LISHFKYRGAGP